MSLNIKSAKVVALVRELAERTGNSQTSAVEVAVARMLAELDQGEVAARRDAGHAVLGQLRRALGPDDVTAIRRRAEDLYDDNGLPR